MNEDGVFVPNKFYLERTKKEELQAELDEMKKVKGSYECMTQERNEQCRKCIGIFASGFLSCILHQY